MEVLSCMLFRCDLVRTIAAISQLLLSELESTTDVVIDHCCAAIPWLSSLS